MILLSLGRMRIAYVSCLSLLLLCGIVEASGSVSVRSQDGVDFAAFQTFAWMEGTPARRPDAQRRIIGAVERELQSAGLFAVEDTPDLYVMTHALVDRQTIEQLADPTYWEFITGVRSVDAYDLQSGTLVIDLVDASSGQVIWRAVSSGSVSGPLNKNLKKLDKLIRKMLKRFPPDRR